MNSPTLCIVIPAFQEANRLPVSLPRLLDHLSGRPDVEIVVVDDGSTDDTVEVARTLLADHARARVIEGPHRGKGAAVATGIRASTAESVVFMDADMATDLDALDPVVAGLTRADVVLGSRRAPGAEASGLSVIGRASHRGFGLLARLVTGVPVRDFQCGFKAFRSEAAREIFDRVSETGYAFDVEVLMVAHRCGLRILEVPVRWQAIPGSHVRHVADSASMIRQLGAIRWRHRGAGSTPPSRDPLDRHRNRTGTTPGGTG